MVSQVDGTFEIIISGTGPSYHVTATGPGVDPVLADLPSVTQWLTNDLRNTLADMTAETSQARGDEIQAVGEALYKALFTRKVELAFATARSNVLDKKLRLRLLVEPPELAVLPWETMHDGADWLAMRSEAPLVRRFPVTGGQPTSPLTVQPPLRVLFVGASPTGTASIELLEAEEQLVDAFDQLLRQQKVHLYRMLNPTFEELKEELTQDYHILLFLGHGKAADPARTKNPSACIYLDGTSDADLGDHPFIQNEQAQRGERKEPMEGNPVSADMLAKALEGKPTQMVFLSACYTAATVRDKDFFPESFAQILSQQVPAIVAMQYFIGADKGAQLATSFLRSLSALRPADVAFVEARSALVDTADLVTRDHFSPVMYLQYPELNGVDGSFPVNLLWDEEQPPTTQRVSHPSVYVKPRIIGRFRIVPANLLEGRIVVVRPQKNTEQAAESILIWGKQLGVEFPADISAAAVAEKLTLIYAPFLVVNGEAATTVTYSTGKIKVFSELAIIDQVDKCSFCSGIGRDSFGNKCTHCDGKGYRGKPKYDWSEHSASVSISSRISITANFADAEIHPDTKNRTGKGVEMRSPYPKDLFILEPETTSEDALLSIAHGYLREKLTNAVSTTTKDVDADELRNIRTGEISVQQLDTYSWLLPVYIGIFGSIVLQVDGETGDVTSERQESPQPQIVNKASLEVTIELAQQKQEENAKKAASIVSFIALLITMGFVGISIYLIYLVQSFGR